MPAETAGAPMPAHEVHPGPCVITRVDIARIHPYGRNPRRQPNPEYLRIKDSIRAEGLDQPLVITQAPGHEDYVLHTGGNTRLKILKELFEETGEERYARVDCILRTWTKESSVLLAHLRENELRGSLPFIDRALAVFEAKSMFECERSIESLSLHRLERILHEQGFGLSRSMLSKMKYAVEVLWPVMPKALGGGLGRPQVERIRALDRAACTVWLHLEAGDEDQFNQVFGQLCRRYDDAEWDIQLLRTALENELAGESDLDPRVIYFVLEACLAGKPVDGLIDRSQTCVVEDAEFDARLDAEREAASETGDDPVHGDANAMQSPGPWAGESAGETAGPPGNGSAASVAGLNGADHGSHPVIEAPGVDCGPGLAEPGSELQSLRACHYECALRLARHHGLEDRLIALPEQGLGFLLQDIPSRELAGPGYSQSLRLAAAVWWYLAACCEITVAPDEYVFPHLDEDSFLHRVLSRREYGRLCEQVWIPDPASLIAKLGSCLDEVDWQLLMQMTRIYRALGCHARETGQALWGPQDGRE